MDLGGGWYDDKGIMNNISSIVRASEKIREKKHESRAEIVVIIDEKSVMLSHPKTVEAVESFLRNIQLCGAPIDIIYSFDIENADFSYAKTAIFLTPLCISQKTAELVKSKLPQDGTVIFASKTEFIGDVRLNASKNLSVPEFYISDAENVTPVITDGEGRTVCAKTETGDLLVSSLNLSVESIRKILEFTPVKFYAPSECTVYADNRIVSFFAREDVSFVPKVPCCTSLINVMTGERIKSGEKINIMAKRARAFIIE